FSKMLVALVVAEPGNLERTVSIPGAIRVVVDGLTGSREQSGRGVVFAQNQVGVGLAALQGDAHRHLSDRRSSQRISTAERLRTEHNMDARCPPMSHKPVEQQRSRLRISVDFGEDLLDLVDDEENAWHR